ncbi:cytochrome c oxidase subunit 6b [Klebsormidium nitens]|uniref:Cytochrome c oxidase subunit 6b n=1 Tax=Klebsormidium nitens TaxID=105231 RepID=A0A1Y1IA89_KLENI|nr:cytochrome c oxidase subunit 6b [Klebsormidium nitens]|eukprot:GAQ87483.1 cytochrome c oxidase subunit 6b [Klebsormidium nitens]
MGNTVARMEEAEAEAPDVVEESEAANAPEEEATAEQAEEPEEEEEEEEKKSITLDDIKTAPMDYRFPTTNQAKHCFTRYNEYHKCIGEKGEGNSDCTIYAKYYRSLCPGEWVEKWNEQREEGLFAGRY